MDEDQEFVLPPQEERPLVTFALLAYNQEKYIEDAVRGALSQTYSPLEIIISDDNSADRTFQIIGSVVSQYNGPHKIAIQRNEINIGIGSHVNRLIGRSGGELIVLAAGDDISESCRVEELVEFWISNGKRHDSLWSAVKLIDSQGSDLGVIKSPAHESEIETQVRDLVPSVLGSSHAFTKRIHLVFGDFSDQIVYEDRVIAFRSLILGGHGYIDKTLVKYRIHENGVSNNYRAEAISKKPSESLSMHQLRLARSLDVVSQYLADLSRLKICGGRDLRLKSIELAVIDTRREILDERMLFSKSFASRLKAFINLISARVLSPKKYAIYSLGLLHPCAPFLVRKLILRSLLSLKGSFLKKIG